MKSETNITTSNMKDNGVTLKTLQSIIEDAKKKGESDENIIALLDKYDISQEDMDDVYSILETAGVSLDVIIDEDVSIDTEENSTGEDNNIPTYSVEEDQDYVDAFQGFLRTIGKKPLLSATKEVELAKIIEAGKFANDQVQELTTQLKDAKGTEKRDLEETIEQLKPLIDAAAEARNEMVESNLRLVVSIAKKYHQSGMPITDLIQEGSIGLMKAIEKFDYNRGYKFSTYATWWIKQSISRAISDQAKIIRIPVHMSETINKMNRAKAKLNAVLNREPTVEEIAEEMGYTPEKVRDIIEFSADPVSLETPVGDEGESNLGDFVVDDKQETANDILMKELRHDKILEAMETLPPREQRILKMRFGFDMDRIYTLEEIGNEFGITRERIRQIEAKALKKLRHPSRAIILEEFKDDY